MCIGDGQLTLATPVSQCVRTARQAEGAMRHQRAGLLVMATGRAKFRPVYGV